MPFAVVQNDIKQLKDEIQQLKHDVKAAAAATTTNSRDGDGQSDEMKDSDDDDEEGVEEESASGAEEEVSEDSEDSDDDDEEDLEEDAEVAGLKQAINKGVAELKRKRQGEIAHRDWRLAEDPLHANLAEIDKSIEDLTNKLKAAEASVRTWEAQEATSSRDEKVQGLKDIHLALRSTLTTTSSPSQQSSVAANAGASSPGKGSSSSSNHWHGGHWRDQSWQEWQQRRHKRHKWM